MTKGILMVEESEDSDVVTSHIEREMRYANEAYIQREENLAAQRQSLVLEGSGMGVTEVQPVAPVEADPVDAEAAFRHGRLAVVAIIVMVLFWAWIQERRTARKERGVQNGRYGQ